MKISSIAWLTWYRYMRISSLWILNVSHFLDECPSGGIVCVSQPHFLLSQAWFRVVRLVWCQHCGAALKVKTGQVHSDGHPCCVFQKQNLSYPPLSALIFRETPQESHLDFSLGVRLGLYSTDSQEMASWLTFSWCGKAPSYSAVSLRLSPRANLQAFFGSLSIKQPRLLGSCSGASWK